MVITLIKFQVTPWKVHLIKEKLKFTHDGYEGHDQQ